MRLNSIVFILLVLLGLLWFFPLSVKDVSSVYNSTGLVNTTVNITNSAPIVKLVRIDSPINLNGYSNKTVLCNVTTFDYDNNSLSVNATIFHSSSAPLAADDKNYHYFNSSCKRKSSQGIYINWTCAFRVNYFANNGTWYCNSTAKDSNAYSKNQSIAGIVNPLVAIKMTSLMNFGNLPANNISSSQIANVTNAGNRNINITVNGYGQTLGDNLAMVCTVGYIGVSYEKYSRDSVTAYAAMTALSSSNIKIGNFWVNQRTSESLDSLNKTYWRIQVPVGAAGRCNGKILFTAIDKRS